MMNFLLSSWKEKENVYAFFISIEEKMRGVAEQ